MEKKSSLDERLHSIYLTRLAFGLGNNGKNAFGRTELMSSNGLYVYLTHNILDKLLFIVEAKELKDENLRLEWIDCVRSFRVDRLINTEIPVGVTGLATPSDQTWNYCDKCILNFDAALPYGSGKHHFEVDTKPGKIGLLRPGFLHCDVTYRGKLINVIDETDFLLLKDGEHLWLDNRALPYNDNFLHKHEWCKIDFEQLREPRIKGYDKLGRMLKDYYTGSNPFYWRLNWKIRIKEDWSVDLSVL